MSPNIDPEFLPGIAINTLTTDFKADVIAAELVENGIPLDRVILFPLGGFQRPFRKDVESVAEDISDIDKKKYYLVKTHQDGIYDLLPEGLFHSQISVKNSGSENDITKAIEQHRVEEKDARRFFLPFEAAVHQLRVEMTLYENRLDKKGHYNDLLNIFANHWEVFRYLDVHQSNIFLQALPLMHELRDDHMLIERLLEMIFDLPFAVSLRRKVVMQPLDPIFSFMGEARLGVDLTTGNKEYDSGEDEILVNVGPLEDNDLDEFMPGAKNDTILHFLFDYLLPAHMEVSVSLLQFPQLQMMRLQDKEKISKSILGFSTYL